MTFSVRGNLTILRRPVILMWCHRSASGKRSLEAALVEFHRSGFAACPVETITRAAGVPKGSFSNYFRSKEELGAVVIERYAAGLGLSTDADPMPSPLERLRARFTAMRDVLAAHSFTGGCLIGNLGAKVAKKSEPLDDFFAVGFDSILRWPALVSGETPVFVRRRHVYVSRVRSDWST